MDGWVVVLLELFIRAPQTKKTSSKTAGSIWLEDPFVYFLPGMREDFGRANAVPFEVLQIKFTD